MKTLAIILLVAGSLAAASNVPNVKWETSLPEAQKRAKAENKLIFLDVYTGWCYWCKKLEKETFPSTEGKAALARMVPLRIETQDEKYQPTKDNAIERQYQVDGYPTMLILNANGKVVARTPGYLPPEPFAAWVNSIAKK
jgi:thioredoxin-related protein